MLTDPFIKAKKILEKIECHNHKAYFVGGCVRDFLLKRSIEDVDIATSAAPHIIKQLFDKVIPVGIEHGTVIVRYKHESYEVTTFRIDGIYTDKRHPDRVEFIDKIDKDLERRDFTINALAMDKNGVIIDLFNGREDLQNKTIRTVGNGYDRFTEDPLRIIRALRFSSQLGFMIDQETVSHMKKVKQDINNLAIERITNEFTKLFKGQYLGNGIEYLQQTEVHKQLPIIRDYPTIINRLPSPLRPLHSFGEVIALFHHIEPNVSLETWVKQWKCSNKIKQEAIQLVEALDHFNQEGLSKWGVYRLSSLYYEGFVRLVELINPTKLIHLDEVEQIDQSLPIKSKKELALNGNDLIALFPDRRKGSWLQKTINKLEYEVVLGNVNNTKKELKEWIKWNPPEIN
ncbi:CCA tRNA nucleotidyltransferase [Virgibacillus profundi]|uniref:CCA-adding enzyme n=2 Tax=Virgibacillus profundi TaxID=2024555 RepID=A0A2A2ICW9_9BACI|nr:CCA tRNA nucleotidyltransferase [Virgibacillus profundi]PXY53646.1 CCA tRNA nucleotidyltransferase [Virgibacillus profundi]